MRHLPLLFAVVLAPIITGMSGCETGGRYPSYAGVYRLVSRSDGGTALPGYEAAPPEAITVLQGLFDRGTDGLHYRIVITADADGGPVLLYDKDLASRRSRSEVLLPNYHWPDPASDFLGVGNGYACMYDIGARLSVRVIPGIEALSAVYPWGGETVETERGSVTLSAYEGEYRAPDVAAWAGYGPPRITLEYAAYKNLTTSPDFCGGPWDTVNLNESMGTGMTLVYERAAAFEDVDLRSSSAPSLQAEISAAAGLPNGNGTVFPLPGTARDLLDLYQSLR